MTFSNLSSEDRRDIRVLFSNLFFQVNFNSAQLNASDQMSDKNQLINKSMNGAFFAREREQRAEFMS